jgi:hypothetical protein
MNFDPQVFLNQTVDAANSEKRLLVPEGEYQGIILPDKIGATAVNWDGGTFHKLNLQLEIVDSDQKVAATTHRDKNIVKYDVTIDLNEAGNGLDMREGMNVGLGRLRSAVGQNSPGRPWAFSHLGGQIIGFTLIHKLDRNGEPRETVTSVKKVGG